MRKAKIPSRCGFTLLEVVIAMAMLALIAVPAMGIATLVIKSGSRQSKMNDVADLKNRIVAAVEYELRRPSGEIDLDTEFYASEDLMEISFVDDLEKEAYYEGVFVEPEGYAYSSGDAERLFVCRLRWPVGVSDGFVNETFFTFVWRPQ